MCRVNCYLVARHVTDEERERARKGGEWLRQERQRRGYETGVEFAAELGIKQARLSTYENGLHIVEVSVARRIAEVFGVTEWEVWRGLQLPLPREVADEEAIARAFEVAPEVMEMVPEIVERITGVRPTEATPRPKPSPNRRPGRTQPGERRHRRDRGEESAV
jgi:transcriptional regulator with XRE-family HTH domain